MKLKPLTKIQRKFWAFIKAREDMRLYKEDVKNGEIRPPLGDKACSSDPILASFHFCNVNREDDRVTKWIHENVRLKYKDKSLEFMMTQLLICRIFNEPEVLEKILPYRSHDYAGFRSRVIKAEKEVGKLLRGAYLMVPHGRGATVVSYFVPAIRQASSAIRLSGRTWTNTDNLRSLSDILLKCSGVGPFIANQVCTDLRYCSPGMIKDWITDWHTYILCGPGTKRGLDRYFDRRGPDGRIGPKPKYEDEILWILQNHMEDNRPLNVSRGVFDDPNNLSNCFCEFDKYQRALDQIAAGEEPRLHRRYTPHA